ncbi:MAG: hypothetical protein CBB68_02965 [Rhodospirillaceae bacterium TMED8]|nr:hypothetical protein [Magnetovibrio sp.]OUT52329.1 MAG: hypothetical protein CBB68_02965 [Rhodospirillaceae bacterium TMED8]
MDCAALTGALFDHYPGLNLKLRIKIHDARTSIRTPALCSIGELTTTLGRSLHWVDCKVNLNKDPWL